MTSPAKKAKIDDPKGQGLAIGTGNAVIDRQTGVAVMATPPAAEKKDQCAPGTSGTVATTGTIYTDAMDGSESHDESSRGTASPTLTPRDAANSHSARTSPSGASAKGADETNAASMADSLALQSFDDSATEKTGEARLAVNSMTKRVNCYNHLMPYTKIIDEGDFAVSFTGKIICLGPTDSGKSIFIGSFVDPTGQSRLLPAALGSCTKYIIEIQTVRRMDLSLSPIVNVYLPGEDPLEDCSISEAHDGIQKFMNASPVVNSSILPIRVTVVSPHVPDGVTIVDTPGIDPNSPESIARIRKYIAQEESEPISIIFCMSPSDIGYADMAFQKVQECLLERNLPFNDNVMILMSKLDGLIDLNYNEKVNPDATGPAWRVYSALTFSGEFDKARVLPNYRKNLFGIRNPDTGLVARISESEKGDLVDREDKFMEDKGLNTLSGVMIGHRKIGMHLNDTIIPAHIDDSVREIEAELCSELQGAKKNLADLGADPIETGFVEKAMVEFDMSVALQFLPTTNKIGDGVALENSPLLKIVESVANDTDLFAFGFEACKFIDKLKAAILTFVIQTVETGTREVEEPDNMRLRRFWRRALVKFKDEAEYLLEVASPRFAQECAAEIELSQRLSRLLPRMEASGIFENLKISLANHAATIIMKSIYDQIKDGCVRERRGVVDFTEEDSSVRRDREKRIKDLEEKLALLRRLPLPTSRPKKTKNATDSSENHNKERDGDEDGGDDGPTDSPRKGDDNNNENSQDGDDEEDDDAGDGRGGGGNISSVGGGGSALFSRIALARAPTSPAMVSEQSPSESDGSGTDVEDLDPPKMRAMPRTSNGRGRGNNTPRKSSQSTRTSSSSTKRKQNSAGGSSKQTSQRSKVARLTFKVGMKIETHFPKPKKGWYGGEITERKKGINTITYSYDGEYYDASDKQLSQEIRDGKHRLL